jgi:hypothetical protein
MSENERFKFRPGSSRIVKVYPYEDEDGKVVFEKVRYEPKAFRLRRQVNGKYVYNLKAVKPVPYQLPKWKDASTVVICEGEKDADALAELGFGSTSGPFGAASWPPEITGWFKSKTAYVVYDIGEESNSLKVAAALHNTAREIFIVKLPSDKYEFDTSDYLDQFPERAGKITAVQDLLRQAEKYQPPKEKEEEGNALSIEELAFLQIPEIDWLIKPIVERFGFCLTGAQKGVGKSLFVTQMALHAASGTPSFLIEDIKIVKPLNVLLVQQEVSLPGMKDRLIKMRKEKIFNLEGRFRQKTTTGAWWNLTNKEDYKKLIRLIEKYRPDILILDPLYTFYPKELNTSGDISPMMKILSDLKSNFNLGLVVVHHFSNKEDADEVQQRSSVGRFMGHSMIANSADTTIGLDFLHPKYRQQTLPLPYQNYVMVEITTRHGEWPARFAIERKHGFLLFEKSTIWQDLGRSIVPGRIEEILEVNDGELLQKDLIGLLIKEASPTTIRRGIDEALKQGSITKQGLPGKGNPVMLRIRK